MRPRTVGALCDRTGQSQPAVSKHLRVLREAGLVEWDRLSGDRRVRIYRLRETCADRARGLARELSRCTRGAPRRARRRRAREGDLRDCDTPYTTRGTPRIRKRLYWRKEDAEAAERGDPRVVREGARQGQSRAPRGPRPPVSKPRPPLNARPSLSRPRLLGFGEVVLVDPLELVALKRRHSDPGIDHVLCELQPVQQDDPSSMRELACVR